MNRFRFFFAGAVAFFLFSPAGFAKKKTTGDLSDFQGGYNGTGVYDGQLPLIATASVEVGKKGNSATITFSGVITDPVQGKTYPITNVITLKKDKTISVVSSVFNLSGAASAATGTYSVHRDTIHYSAKLTDLTTATFAGIISVNPKSAKPVFKMAATIAGDGMTYYTFTFALAKLGVAHK